MSANTSAQTRTGPSTARASAVSTLPSTDSAAMVCVNQIGG